MPSGLEPLLVKGLIALVKTGKIKILAFKFVGWVKAYGFAI